MQTIKVEAMIIVDSDGNWCIGGIGGQENDYDQLNKKWSFTNDMCGINRQCTKIYIEMPVPEEIVQGCPECGCEECYEGDTEIIVNKDDYDEWEIDGISS